MKIATAKKWIVLAEKLEYTQKNQNFKLENKAETKDSIDNLLNSSKRKGTLSRKKKSKRPASWLRGAGTAVHAWGPGLTPRTHMKVDGEN